MNRLRNHINAHPKVYAIGVVLVLSFVARVWNALQDVSVWWDASIYIGMGKYIATGGTIGLWEIFRPPLFPLFYAGAYILHLPLIFLGKAIAILASIACLWIVYVLAESIRKGSGILAAIFLSITPVFFVFSKIAITDISSAFFVLAALWMYRKEKYFLAGIMAGIAFLLRFPQGLAMAALACIIIVDTYNPSLKEWIIISFKRGLSVAAGFFLLAGPYLISNHFLYGDVLLPLELGNIVIGGYSYLYDLGTWFYATELAKTAPCLVLAIAAPFLLLKKSLFGSHESKRNLRAVLVMTLVFIVYFFWQSHKELRYSIAFVPSLAILAGVVASILFDRIRHRRVIWRAAVLIILTIFLYQSFPYLLKGRQVDTLAPIHEYMSTIKGDYISTTPVPAIYGDIHIVEFYDSMQALRDVLKRRALVLDGVVFTSCDMMCSPETNNSKSCMASVLEEVAKTPLKKVYDTTVGQCSYVVFHK